MLTHAMKTLYRNRSAEDAKLSMKQYLRKVFATASDDDKKMINTWLGHKAGVLVKAAKEKRQEYKGGTLAEVRMKVKMARRKNSGTTTAKPEIAKKAKKNG